MSKTAVITGITGQDGSYLAQWLLSKGYRVVGWYPPDRPLKLWRLERLGLVEQVELRAIDWHQAAPLAAELNVLKPQELYHLAARSSLADSESAPLETAELDGIAPARLLEGIRLHSAETRFLLASSAEVFGHPESSPQNESTPMRPVTLYGCCKVNGQNITAFYRRKFGLFACSAILFNHESPLRDDRFLTQKVLQGLKRLREGSSTPLSLGSLESRRDWGCADEYVQAMWRMLQTESPEDFVLATGESTSVRRFVEICAEELGFQMVWRTTDQGEEGFDRLSNRLLVTTSPDQQRNNDTLSRVGDASRAWDRLGWRPTRDLRSLISWMVGN
ncbi:GDP-mannose 4,6-dehydratase [bacterium]|nr:GDP-mannose 4,6-dehydratase [bacterium]